MEVVSRKVIYILTLPNILTYYRKISIQMSEKNMNWASQKLKYCSHPSKRSKYDDTGGLFISTGKFARGNNSNFKFNFKLKH